MATVNLNATHRTETGKGAARKARAAGQLPAIIYRAGQPGTAINLNPDELELAFKRTGDRNTLVSLDVDGTSYVCLVKSTQRHPVTAVLRHVDFYQVDENETVVVQVPIETTGSAAGMVEGGVLRMIQRTLSIRCKPGDIPAKVEYDITDVEFDQYVKVSELTAPEGAEIIAESDFNVLAIVGRRVAAEEDLIADTDDEEGVEGAEGEESEEGGDESASSEESGD